MKTISDEEYEALQAAARERDRLHSLINSPELLDFREAVLREAVHQRERWGSDDDSGKTPADWHWLVAHLAGKALGHAQEFAYLTQANGRALGLETVIKRHREKAVHHCVTTAAAVANWHAAMLGLTNMQPGITEPAQASHGR